MDMFINFSYPFVIERFDVKTCTWAFGMNLFDLQEWKRHNLTALYNKYLQLDEIEQAAVLRYDGVMKPWLEIGIGNLGGTRVTGPNKMPPCISRSITVIESRPYQPKVSPTVFTGNNEWNLKPVR
ncbi:hypothetical protein H0E87_004023 [Populus deltoides]|uniref:Hexosyltransferase n=1 Tax=Populus deltoides TaxID=3696 RepID=A0A8T2ZDD1_POPDE|nr:hypothetical protein H0E87_004023 [Populus deltoides]